MKKVEISLLLVATTTLVRYYHAIEGLICWVSKYVIGMGYVHKGSPEGGLHRTWVLRLGGAAAGNEDAVDSTYCMSENNTLLTKDEAISTIVAGL